MPEFTKRFKERTNLLKKDCGPLCSVETVAVLSELDLCELRLGETLGHGGFGTVYQGTYRKKRVAVKKIRPNIKKPRAVVQSFLAESTAPGFRHPNIVSTLAVSGPEISGELVIIMEYAGSKTLKSVINNEIEVISQRRRLSFALDISNALEFIHSSGIAHLDVKPANIIINDQDVCRLGDFGCSQSIGEDREDLPTTPTRSCLTGTLAYRAPELLKGEPASTKADMYSLGVCLWQIYSRERPYGDENMFVIIFGVVANHLRPQLPDAATMAEDGDYFELVQLLWKAEVSERPSAEVAISYLKKLRGKLL